MTELLPSRWLLLLTTMMILRLQCARGFPPRVAVVSFSSQRALTRATFARPSSNLFIYSSASTRRWASSSQQRQDRRKAATNKSSSSFPTAVLKRSRQSKTFRNGNPLVFPKAIDGIMGCDGSEPDVGSLVHVVVQDDNNGKSGTVVPIGWGVYNPNSLYRIRIFCHRAVQPKLYKKLLATSKEHQSTNEQDHQTTMMHQLIHQHVSVARQKRRALNLPSDQHTTMYRLINGEGDCLSGLHVDVCGNVIVVQSSAAWCQLYRPVIMDVLEQVMQPENDTPTQYEVVWKVAPSRLQQDGYPVPPENDDDSIAAPPVIAYENGVPFQLYPQQEGQKTGVYCDQRDNRALLARYTQGKTVLDLCCYHAGFSITALVQGGAMSAVAVDSSAAAIQCATDNAQLNKIGDDRLTCIQSDVTAYLQQQHNDSNVSFDVVVLDPPKLAPTVASLDKARRKYHGLNRDAIKLVSPQHGGLLLTCTCSAAMTQAQGGQTFLQMVAGAALAAQREVTLLQVAGAAACHAQSPQAFPTGAYLTAALFYVHPVETEAGTGDAQP